DLLVELKKIRPQTLAVVMTAYASIENAVSVVKEGAFDYLAKPFTNAQLGHLLNKVRMLVELRRENEQLRSQGRRHDFFLGFTSPANRRLEEFVRKVAPSEATILLTGESGTGKSELARLIHERSPRAGKPFVTVYCTTLTESLLEAELFGHVKGSFTGAVQDRAGKIEAAEGGTLFLDEIGDLSPNAQAKLLRFLQDRVIERVGAHQEISVNARIIAATNKNLAEAVESGAFREDLYYRLNIFECPLVALRHRREDVPVLLEQLLEEFRIRAGLKEKPKLDEKVRKALLEYAWPGNIRELRNVVERLVLLSSGREVRWEDLPESILHVGTGPVPKGSALVSLEELEKNHIQFILSQEKNLEKASEILGITPVTLWRKRKQYGLN
ncbi:MAG: sigma-54 dependent transcriptional regulator, partial [Deltaproteobacteria bacterium]|nr:sigma-54 dependent transcriptional regulator [Deltaproteobacteria bacterium]